MPRKTKLESVLQRAAAEASQEILQRAICDLPRGTTMGDLTRTLTASDFGDAFRQMTLEDFSAAISGGRAVKRGRPAGSAAKAAASPGRKVSYNTRTAGGRTRLDAAIVALLTSRPGARSEDVSREITATTAQIRQSLNRMIGEGRVTKKGEKRATEYSLVGAGARRAKTAARGTKKKAAARRTTKKPARAKKKAARRSKKA